MKDNSKNNSNVLLHVEHLKQYFKSAGGYEVKAVDDISFDIYEGETFGLVGESGSGKSTTGRSIIRLTTPTSGKIVFDGVDYSDKVSDSDMKHLRANMQMIFQDPYSCLNPRKKVLDIVKAPLLAQGIKDKDELNERALKMLDMVGITKEQSTHYPAQFSGGQRQRVGIARALVTNPKLVIADECISALDVSIQAQIVNLMKDLQKELGVAYLFIAHDLSMVKFISDRIGVMHLGHILELGTTDDIFSRAEHPYTQSLLSAIPYSNPLIECVRKPTEYNKGDRDYAASSIKVLSDTHWVLK